MNPTINSTNNIIRSACCHHYLSGSWYQTYGQEKCHCPFTALCGDPGLYFCHLLRQDWHPDHQSDVCDQSRCLATFMYTRQLRKNEAIANTVTLKVKCVIISQR